MPPKAAPVEWNPSPRDYAEQELLERLAPEWPKEDMGAISEESDSTWDAWCEAVTGNRKSVGLEHWRRMYARNRRERGVA